MFYPWCFFYSPGYLRAPSADRRETLPYDRNMGVLYNASQKNRKALPAKEIGGQNHAKFGAILDNFKLRSQISPKRVKISKIGKTCDHQRFLPRSRKKSCELWCTNYRELYVSLNPPKLHFSGDYISALRWCWLLKFWHALQIDQGLLAHTPNGDGGPPQKKLRANMSNLA